VELKREIAPPLFVPGRKLHIIVKNNILTRESVPRVPPGWSFLIPGWSKWHRHPKLFETVSMDVTPEG